MSYESNVQSTDNANKTKAFFDNYGKSPINFASNEVDAVVSFFESKGFARQSAQSTSIVILGQAKAEEKPVFQILEDLKKIDEVQLTDLVAAVLNSNRNKVSKLGYKQTATTQTFNERNVVV